MGRMFYKYSVYVIRNGKDEFFADVTTATAARKLICRCYEIGANINKMWVKNNETGLFEGMVQTYTGYNGRNYVYCTTDSKERKINTDGTFVKKKKNEWRPFGL